MPKTKSITLAYARLGNTYEVQSITNSALLNPGDWINPAYRAALVAHPDWEVITISLHISMPINPATIISAIPGVL
jgi:hypothetical protein